MFFSHFSYCHCVAITVHSDRQNTLPSYQGWRPKCPVHFLSTYSRCIGFCFSRTILAGVLCTHSQVVQFLYAEWQQFLSVSYLIFSTSLCPLLLDVTPLLINTFCEWALIPSPSQRHQRHERYLVQRGVFHPL